MRVSILHYDHEPIGEILAIAEAADALGFDGWYVTDSTFRKDLWVVLGAAARLTKRIRLGPSAARLSLVDPLVTARALATLDELSDGRVDGVLGLGSRHIVWRDSAPSPVRFMREAVQVIRAALSSDRVTFAGKELEYDTGAMRLAARPVQEHLPLWIGTMGGPKLTELAGEVADGMHLAPGYTRAASAYAIERVRAGADRAGRDWRTLDIGMNPIVVVAEDGDVAREVARVHAAFYFATLSPSFVQVINEHRVPEERVVAIGQAWAAGELRRAAELVPWELAEVLAVAGTPEECLAQFQLHLPGSGVNHLVLMLADEAHVEMITGERPPYRVPTVLEQLELVSRKMLPALRAMS